MTEETPTGVALQYVREELSNLRAAVHDDVAAMRGDISGLAGELRGHMAEQRPRIAVLEHRVVDVEKKIENAGDRRWLLYLALLAAVVSLINSFVAPALGIR